MGFTTKTKTRNSDRVKKYITCNFYMRIWTNLIRENIESLADQGSLQLAPNNSVTASPSLLTSAGSYFLFPWLHTQGLLEETPKRLRYERSSM